MSPALRTLPRSVEETSRSRRSSGSSREASSSSFRPRTTRRTTTSASRTRKCLSRTRRSASSSAPRKALSTRWNAARCSVCASSRRASRSSRSSGTARVSRPRTSARTTAWACSTTSRTSTPTRAIARTPTGRSSRSMDRTPRSGTSAKVYEQILNNHESIGVKMSEYIALGDWRLFFYRRDSMAGVTPEQVSTIAQRYFKRDNRIVGFFVPEDTPQRAEIPAAPNVAEVLKDFKPKAALAQAEAFDPSNANIDKRTKHLEIGGLKVALLQKKNRGETVNLSLRFHTGDEKTLFGKTTAQSFAAAMLSRGTTKLTRTQIADELDRLKVSGSVNGLNAQMQTTKPNLAAAI